MTELAVRDRTIQPEATKGQEQVKPNATHRLLADAIMSSQTHKRFHYVHSSAPMNKPFESNPVGYSTEGKHGFYMGRRYKPGEGVLYGLIDGKDLQFENGKPKEKILGDSDERVYRTSDEVAELLGDEAEKHAARILWRIARDKNTLLPNMFTRGKDLASIGQEKGGGAVVFVVDAKNNKAIRIFTGKSMPTDEQEGQALIKEARELVAEPSIQDSMASRKLQAIDIRRDKNKYLIGDSDDFVDTKARIIDIARVDGIAIERNYRYLFPSRKEETNNDGAKETVARTAGGDELSQLVAWLEATHGQEIIRDKTRTAVFVPGWSMGGNTESAKRPAQQFANNARDALVVDTRPEKLDEESYWNEAYAIVDLLKQEGRKKVTLIGHSQGGIKAACVAYILQEERKLAADPSNIPQVEGLTLVDPVGMYEQRPYADLALGFTLDTGKTAVMAPGRSLAEWIKHGGRRLFKRPEPTSADADAGRKWFGRSLQAGYDIGINGMVREALRSTFSGKSYRARFNQEVKSMARSYQEILSKIVPGYKNMSLSERETELKNNLFMSASSVMMVTADDMGRHGLPLFRNESVGLVGTALLDEGVVNYIRANSGKL